MKLIAGSSHPALARSLADALGITLGVCDISRYDDGGFRLRIIDRLKGKDVVILQTLNDPIHDHFVELLLLIDAAKNLEAGRITVVIPWFAYSKQNRMFMPGEPVSVRVLARCISALPVDRVIAVDLHASNIASFFSVPIRDVSCRALFVNAVRNKINETSIVVAPDKGGVERSRAFANELGLPVVIIEKTRNRMTGEVTIHSVSGDVSGKQCFVFDDMIATGETMIDLAYFLKKHKTSSVTICATHGLFTRGVEVFQDAPIDHLYIADTVPVPDRIPVPTIVISVASVLAEVIKHAAE